MSFSLEKKVWFPIPQGQNWVIVTGAGLSFDPVEAEATTSSGAGGPVIAASADRTTLTRDGGLFNLTGSTLDGNQVLVATFYGEPGPCPPQPPPAPPPACPDFFITVADLMAELQPILWPYGEAENLIGPHLAFLGEALTQLQQYAMQLQENNIGLFPFCSTFFECGMTVIDAPFNGIIRKVSTYDEINETTGLEDSTQYPNWCSEVRYTNVDYRMLRKFVDKNLAYLGFPAGNFGCGCGILLPAISPLLKIFQQFAWCGKQPVTPYTNPDQTGMPNLPQGFLFPNANADGTRRARAGMWAQHRGRIYMAPWIQSTETILVEWDGMRFKWSATDLSENNNLIKKAVKNYIWWQHYAAGYDDNPEQKAQCQQEWLDARAELLHFYRQISRRRMIEESFARAAQQSIISEGVTTTTSTTTTTLSTSSTSSTTVSTASTSSTSSTTVSTASTTSSTSTSSTTSSTSSTTVSTNSTTSTSTTSTTSTSTAGQVFLGAVTVGTAVQTYDFSGPLPGGAFPPGHYRVYYEAGMACVPVTSPSYTGGLSYANGSLPPTQPWTFAGFVLFYQAGGLSEVYVPGPSNSDFTQYAIPDIGNNGDNNTALGQVQSHFSGAYVDFTTTVNGGIVMEYVWGGPMPNGIVFYPAGVTFNLYQVYP